jgi:hypothetical protein
MPSKYSECKSPVISATGLSAIDRSVRLTASKGFFSQYHEAIPAFRAHIPPQMHAESSNPAGIPDIAAAVRSTPDCH